MKNSYKLTKGTQRMPAGRVSTGNEWTAKADGSKYNSGGSQRKTVGQRGPQFDVISSKAASETQTCSAREVNGLKPIQVYHHTNTWGILVRAFKRALVELLPFDDGPCQDVKLSTDPRLVQQGSVVQPTDSPTMQASCFLLWRQINIKLINQISSWLISRLVG
jgi:hypothetical protein